jgi:hypothetical protein
MEIGCIKGSKRSAGEKGFYHRDAEAPRKETNHAKSISLCLCDSVVK